MEFYLVLFLSLGFLIAFLFYKRMKMAICIILLITIFWFFIFKIWAILTAIELFVGYSIGLFICDKARRAFGKSISESSQLDKLLDGVSDNLIQIDKQIEYDKEQERKKLDTRVRCQIENKDYSKIVNDICSREVCRDSIKNDDKIIDNVCDSDLKDELIEKYNILSDKENDDLNLEKAVKNRHIEYLFHFTQEENIDSIISYGLLPRRAIDSAGIASLYNDFERSDGRVDTSSLSIGFPNSRMFYKYRKLGERQNKRWGIFVFKSSVLYEKQCLFCFTNAANHQIRQLQDGNLQGKDAFEKMFGDEVLRENANLPVSFPLDEQAEVLVKGVVDPCYIHSIVFNKKELFYKYKRKYPNIDVRYDISIFNSREYFLDNYWRK